MQVPELFRQCGMWYFLYFHFINHLGFKKKIPYSKSIHVSRLQNYKDPSKIPKLKNVVSWNLDQGEVYNIL
jgi:hypothetical protein